MCSVKACDVCRPNKPERDRTDRSNMTWVGLGNRYHIFAGPPGFNLSDTVS